MHMESYSFMGIHLFWWFSAVILALVLLAAAHRYRRRKWFLNRLNHLLCKSIAPLVNALQILATSYPVAIFPLKLYTRYILLTIVGEKSEKFTSLNDKFIIWRNTFWSWALNQSFLCCSVWFWFPLVVWSPTFIPFDIPIIKAVIISIIFLFAQRIGRLDCSKRVLLLCLYIL